MSKLEESFIDYIGLLDFVLNLGIKNPKYATQVILDYIIDYFDKNGGEEE